MTSLFKRPDLVAKEAARLEAGQAAAIARHTVPPEQLTAAAARAAERRADEQSDAEYTRADLARLEAEAARIPFLSPESIALILAMVRGLPGVLRELNAARDRVVAIEREIELLRAHLDGRRDHPSQPGRIALEAGETARGRGFGRMRDAFVRIAGLMYGSADADDRKALRDMLERLAAIPARPPFTAPPSPPRLPDPRAVPISGGPARR